MSEPINENTKRPQTDPPSAPQPDAQSIPPTILQPIETPSVPDAATLQASPQASVRQPDAAPAGAYILPPKPERPAFAWDRAELWLWPLAFLMGYLTIRLIFEAGTGLAAVLFIAGVYLTTAVYMKLAGIRPVWNGPSLAWTALTAALTVSLILLDGGEARQILVLLATLFCAAIQLYTMLGCRLYGFEERAVSDWANAVLCTPFANMGTFWQTLGAMLKKGKSRSLLGVLVGFIVGLPLLIVLIVLLASADGAFETFINRYVTDWFDHIGTSLLRLIFGIPFAMGAFGILYGCRHKLHIHRFEADTDARKIPVSAACGVLIPITVLYLVYLGTQAAYFFSAFAGLLPEGFTYAEYARRGFFELCVICAINLGLIAALTAFVRMSEGARRFFRSFFAVFSLVLTGTALSKMVLYVRNYGMTPLRLQTTVFMLALGLVLVWVLLKTWIARFPVMRLIAVTAAAALLLFAFTDADAFSVRYNIEAIERGVLSGDLLSEKADVRTASYAGFSYYELLHMSDGIEPILRAHPSGLAQSVLSERAADRAERSWLAWTVAEARAGK